MLRRFDYRILFGGLLIGVGILFLLQEFGLIPDAWGLLWAVVFILAGAIFIYSYFTNRAHWWPLIPGLSLLGIGILIFLDSVVNVSIGNWGGAIVLGGIGLSFLLIFLFHRENWWAIIPGGVMITLAFVAGLEDTLGGDADGGIFFLGLGLTFVILGFLRTDQGRMKWAFIPAAVLLLMGFLLTPPLSDYFMYVWPAVLILLGIYFILRNIRS
jgi:hypothetical protein